MTHNCKECQTELTLIGVLNRHGSKQLHCEHCHLDHMYVKDPNGPNFLDTREQHNQENCTTCADGGPTTPTDL